MSAEEKALEGVNSIADAELLRRAVLYARVPELLPSPDEGDEAVVLISTAIQEKEV